MKLDNFSQLKDHFAVAEQQPKRLRLYDSIYNPRNEMYPDRQALSERLEIGAKVFVKLGAFVPDYTGDREARRPAIVQALWRNNENEIIKIEVLASTSRFNRYNPHDFAVPVKGEIKGRTVTVNSYIIDNISKYVHLAKKHQEYIDSALWPDLLVRRAYNILYNGALGLTMPSVRDDGLTREGFTFDEIQPHSVKNGLWVPDLPGGNFNRMASSVVPQDTVNQIARYAGYFMENIARGDRGIAFPPQQEWPEKFAFTGFRDWENDSVKQIMMSHGL